MVRGLKTHLLVCLLERRMLEMKPRGKKVNKKTQFLRFGRK